jgi:hypothetical protein
MDKLDKLNNLIAQVDARIAQIDENTLNESQKNMLGEYKEKMSEGRRSDEFFTSKFGIQILDLIQKNNGVFDKEQIRQYLSDLEQTNDIKWGRIMDMIANQVGIDTRRFATYGEQENAIIDAIEKLYVEHNKGLM